MQSLKIMKNIIKKFKQTSRGGVLILMTLFILIIVLLIGLSIATLTMKQLKMSQSFESSMVAYYAADAALEKTLYDYKKALADNSLSLPSSVDGVKICDKGRVNLIAGTPGSAQICVRLQKASNSDEFWADPISGTNLDDLASIQAYGFYKDTIRVVSNSFK